MKGHSPEFIRNRIEWRLGKHGRSYPRTGFWKDAPDPLKAALPADFVNPVIFSIPDCGGLATVLGTEEVAAGSDLMVIRLSLDEIRAVSSPCIDEGKERSEFDVISVTMADGKHHYLPMETGSPFSFYGTFFRCLSPFRGVSSGDYFSG